MHDDLAEVARRSDAAVAQARAELVAAVREAAAAGLTQTTIGQAIGRSQPEVSRLLRFHGTSALARKVRRRAREVRQVVEAAGGSNVRVFGSVANGEDGPDSDVDLVFAMGEPLSMMELGRLERQLADLIGAPVDLVPEDSLRPEIRDRLQREAVAL